MVLGGCGEGAGVSGGSQVIIDDLAGKPMPLSHARYSRCLAYREYEMAFLLRHRGEGPWSPPDRSGRWVYVGCI